MSLYVDYYQLAESNQLDKIVYNSPFLVKWSLIILSLMHGPNAFLFCYMILFARTVIVDVYIRRSLGWGLVLWSLFNGAYAWMYIYLAIELIREFLRFGLPYILLKMGNDIQTDPVTETLARRIFRILKVISQQHPLLSGQQLLVILTGYHQADQSEALNEEEKKKFQKFFRDFPKTCFIYENDNNALTIMFPSFIIRFSHQGIQITSDDAMKLIRGDEVKDDICSICRDKCDTLSIELKCKHIFCQKCIFHWLSLQYSCPSCRAEVN